MKRYIAVMLAVLVISAMCAVKTVYADGCYICEGGWYVKYIGSDTFDKRKKAKEQFSCTVSGTTSTCSNPKGTVN